jgi:hypothetical protein
MSKGAPYELKENQPKGTAPEEPAIMRKKLRRNTMANTTLQAPV